ncbi:MAG: WS/DGAT domain-containing protein [Clostridia bacterium]|nr:WS/DGAT domain-containing protein [Clostridia bacterium]
MILFSTQKRISYKAELWDKMQHIMERYNDHMAHCCLEFDGMLDFGALKKAVQHACNRIPLFKCVFSYGFFKAQWLENKDFSIDDTVSLAETEQPEKLSQEFLTQKLDERQRQLKVLLVRSGGRDTLNIVLNHMIMDGADIKQFVALIAAAYTDIMKGGAGKVPFKSGRRDEAQILEGFSAEERKKVERLLSYSKKAKHKISFPYESISKKETKPFIERLIVPSDLFLKSKEKASRAGYTVNDLVVACFYRALYSFMDIDVSKSLGLPCMVDLRKYMQGGDSLGATNLTSMVVCNIGSDIGKDIFETLEKVNTAMSSLKRDYPGLYGLPLLRGVFKYVPYALAKFLIGTFFKNPLIGISNIGVVKQETLNFNGRTPSYLYFTGSIKYAPYYQLALTTYKNEMTFSTAVYGTEKDRQGVKLLFEHMQREFYNFCQ